MPALSTFGLAKLIVPATILWLIIIIKKNANIIVNIEVMILGVLFIYFLINSRFNNGNFLQVRLKTYIYICCIILISIYYIKLYNKYKVKKLEKILTFTFIFIFISCVISIIMAIKNPNLLKSLAGGGGELQTLYLKKGLSGYGDIYGKALLGPSLLFFYLKSNKKAGNFLNKLIVLDSILCIINVFVYSYTIAILLCILISIIYLSLINKIFRRIIFIIILFICIFYGPFIKFVKYISANLENSDISIRLNSIVQFLSNGVLSDESGISRLQLYKLSFKTFCENPLWGIGGYYGEGYALQFGIGLHSEWLDMLARYGIIGITLFYICCNKIKKMMLFSIRKNVGNCSKKYIWVMGVYFLILGLINTVFSSNLTILSIIFIVPGIIIILSDKGNEKNEK